MWLLPGQLPQISRTKMLNSPDARGLSSGFPAYGLPAARLMSVYKTSFFCRLTYALWPRRSWASGGLLSPDPGLAKKGH